MTAFRIDGAFQRGRPIAMRVDGRSVPAFEGETVAAALMAAGLLTLRDSPRAGGARGAFCFMGVCQECAILIDGEVRQACLTPASDGLAIARRGPL